MLVKYLADFAVKQRYWKKKLLAPSAIVIF
jgi:hypothetical protein